MTVSQEQLVYPIEAPPRIQSVIEIAPNIFWARLPLPFQLDHINVWFLRDGDELTLIDTGINGEESLQTICSLVRELSPTNTLSRVIVTHMHPDHVGAAGWLVDHYGAEFWMSPLEYAHAKDAHAGVAGQMPDSVSGFYKAAGWSEAALENYTGHYGGYRALVHRLPEHVVSLKHNQEHRLGGYRWRAIGTRGHSPEHISLYCEAVNLLISGDQVLPRITSNVSVVSSAPLDDPLSDWLFSLERIKQSVPSSVTVLPSHQECFTGLHLRIDQIAESHAQALYRLLEALVVPLRAVDTFEALFHREISETQVLPYRLATGEALASLNYLINRGFVSCRTDEAGVSWYTKSVLAAEWTGRNILNA